MALEQYGWNSASNMAGAQAAVLDEVGSDLLAYADQATGGHGQDWMARVLPKVTFHTGGLPQAVVTLANNKAPTSVVFPMTDVWLVADFDQRLNPRQHVMHELGHVVDNCMAGKFLPATFFGGGPADELVRYAGGNPTGLRFKNAACGISAGYLWPEGAYGNSATAEYFAEVFAHSIFQPETLPDPALKIWLEGHVFGGM